ncbi:hypothetical protein D3C83_180020 [compost metagenome]
MWASGPETLPNMTAIWPDIRSTYAGATPLYGTWFSFTFALDWNSSMPRWVRLPIPADP